MPTLAELHHQYRVSLIDKRDTLRVAWDALCDEDVGVEQVERLHLLLHQLTGSAGTYGYPDIAAAAWQLEQVWSAWLDESADKRLEAWQLCARHAVALADLLDRMSAEAETG